VEPRYEKIFEFIIIIRLREWELRLWRNSIPRAKEKKGHDGGGGTPAKKPQPKPHGAARKKVNVGRRSLEKKTTYRIGSGRRPKEEAHPNFLLPLSRHDGVARGGLTPRARNGRADQEGKLGNPSGGKSLKKKP